MKKLIFLLLTALLITGCTTKYSSLPESRVFINNTNFSKIDSLRTGEVCKRQFLFFKFGNKLTSKAAAKNGRISKIEYQETTSTLFFPFYSSRCLKVYGE
jgi:uncharacterized protein YcfL